ncbi:MAG: hypothetical protein ACYTHK_17265, partial [Planctomycetota bacterium]
MRRWPLLRAPWARAEPNRGPFSKIAVNVLDDPGEQMIDPSMKTLVLYPSRRPGSSAPAASSSAWSPTAVGHKSRE